MKKINFPNLCIFVLTTALISISCNKNIDVPLSQELIGKWTMESAVGTYTIMGISQQDTTWFTSNDFVEFKNDGTLAIEKTDKKFDGKWKMESNKLVITETDYIDYPGGFDISRFTGTNLQLYFAVKDSLTSLEHTLNFKK